MNSNITRAEWLLLFLSSEALGLTEDTSLDPIRIQKGMFLLSQRGPKRDLYSFKPYNWGPFSSDIYTDLLTLEADHLITSESVPAQTWSLYRPTAQGNRRAADVAAAVGVVNTRWLAQMRRFVTTRPFVQLLKEVYAMYPEYATKSLMS